MDAVQLLILASVSMLEAQRKILDRKRFDKDLIGSINDAAGYCRTLWVAFITYAGALFILISGTTHEDLLRMTPVRMPLFDLGVPLLLFYVIAPLLLVLFHINLLMKLHDLRLRVRKLADTTTEQNARDALRRRLMAFDYAVLAGRLVTDKAERFPLSIITNTTVFVIPVILLLFVQLRFLPFHEWKMSWYHRGLIISDIGLIFYIQLWLGNDTRAIKSFTRFLLPDLRKVSTSIKSAVLDRRWDSLYALISAVFPLREWLAAIAIGTAVFVFAYPGERQDILWSVVITYNQSHRLKEGQYYVYDEFGFFAFAGPDPAETFGIVRSLYLPNRIFWAQDSPSEILAAYEMKRSIDLQDENSGKEPQTNDLRLEAQRSYGKPMDLRGRNLSYANFGGATFIDADFTGDDTNLRGADLSEADLRGAKLGNAQMQDANLSRSRLEGADMRSAQLQGDYLGDARMQGAVIESARMQGADLSRAQLQGAKLAGAHMQGANLSNAQMQGANLSHVDMRGANLSEARMQGADLRQAELQGANLRQVELQGADLGDARMQGANLADALMHGANLSHAQLQGAFMRATEFQGADLSQAHLQGTMFFNAKLKGADFARANVTLAEFLSSDLDSDVNFDEVLGNLRKSLPNGAQKETALLTIEGARKRIKTVASGLTGAEGENVELSRSSANAAIPIGTKIKLIGFDSYTGLLKDYLLRLACPNTDYNNDSDVRAIAEGIAENRALNVPSLAQAMLDKPCARTNLSDKTIANLKSGIDLAKERLKNP